MMHVRRWCLHLVDAPETLAEKLSEATQTCCSAFQVPGTPYYFVNDATGENGAQEYGIVKLVYRQVESITFSWCSPEKALAYIERVLAGYYDNASYAFEIEGLEIESPDVHGTCPLCA